MALRSLLSADRIAILVGPDSRAAVLDAAARLLAQPGAQATVGTSRQPSHPAGSTAGSTRELPTPESSTPGLIDVIGAGLHQREQLASTAIGHGVAIPHARVAGLDQSRCAFLRLNPPVDFDAADGQPVDLVLALAEPAHHVQQHLELLAELSQTLASPDYRASLRTASTIDLLRRRLLDGDGAPPSSREPA